MKTCACCNATAPVLTPAGECELCYRENVRMNQTADGKFVKLSGCGTQALFRLPTGETEWVDL